MTQNYNPRIVFITGGANGIGKEMVKTFSRQGDIVCFCDKNKTEGENLLLQLNLENINAFFYELDVSDHEALEGCMENVWETFSRIDILINNAGISEFYDFTEMGIEQFDKIIQTNLRPAYVTARKLAILRKKNEITTQYGRIINIASTRFLMSEPHSEGYAASKGGLVSLTHALAMSLAGGGITVNCISPGWIHTGNYDELTESDHLQHPVGRVGRPVDIANACIFLAREDNNFITGQNLIIDGGITKKMIYT